MTSEITVASGVRGNIYDDPASGFFQFRDNVFANEIHPLGIDVHNQNVFFFRDVGDGFFRIQAGAVEQKKGGLWAPEGGFMSAHTEYGT